MKKTINRSIIIIIIVLWSIIPIYWTLRTSLLEKSELMVTPIKYLPIPINLGNFQQLFGLGGISSNVKEEFIKALLNSLTLSIFTTIMVCVVSVMAGYAFSRFKFKGKRLIFGLITATLALPVYSVIIPLYRIVIKMNLIDTKLGMTLILTAAIVPLTVWLMKNFFNTIPIELEEAALIDGASRFRTLLTILPLATPGIIAVAIITFLNTWSQFFLPLIFSTIETKPLTVFITQFVSKTSVDYGMMTAAGIIVILPPILIVLFLNKYLVNGLMDGAVKE